MIILNNKQKDSFIKVMTLNVNGFRRIGNRGLSNQFCLRIMKQIRQLIDTVMINKNNIIILQEVPHKIKDNQRGWYNNPLYNKFMEVFQNYKILKPKYLIDSNQCTVAVCRKDSSWKQLQNDILQYNSRYSYGNKFVELQCSDLTLLGVHMPVKNEMWNLLLQALKDTPYTYVIGDFNANEKRGEMHNKPKKIRDCGYNNLIANNVITCYSYQSSIDNIFIRSNFTTEENVAVKVVNTHLTDHALCSFEHSLN